MLYIYVYNVLCGDDVDVDAAAFDVCRVHVETESMERTGLSAGVDCCRHRIQIEGLAVRFCVCCLSRAFAAAVALAALWPVASL